MYVEKYFSLIHQDLAEIREALSQSMPDAVRAGLETELRKLQMLDSALRGELDKSTLHQLRANLRWKRQELQKEHDHSKRRKIEAEVAKIEAEIKREVERTWGARKK